MSEGTQAGRPVIFSYRAIPHYLRAMFEWHKRETPRFSLRRATAPLRRCSPALVSQVLGGKRKLTPERVEAFAKLFALSGEERSYLARWVTVEEGGAPEASPRPAPPKRLRRTGQNHVLTHWLNLYVKDAARLRGFRPSPATIHRLLGGIASPRAIEKSLAFLFREGFLRRTIDGRVVEDEVLVTSTDEERSRLVQRFHLRALDIAKRGLRLYPMEERQASALLLPLDEESFLAVKEKLKAFYEELLEFAETHTGDDRRLYQITLHLTPIGGPS